MDPLLSDGVIGLGALEHQAADELGLVRGDAGQFGVRGRRRGGDLEFHDADEALERLHALAAIGVRLSIDDFGTGYSSLSYLKRFPIGKLKIDRSFITGLPQDESDRAIVSATIAMAQALKLAVVAEGVETQAQMDCLRELGCASYQGFLCSPAMPADAFAQWMTSQPGD